MEAPSTVADDIIEKQIVEGSDVFDIVHVFQSSLDFKRADPLPQSGRAFQCGSIEITQG